MFKLYSFERYISVALSNIDMQNKEWGLEAWEASVKRNTYPLNEVISWISAYQVAIEKENTYEP